MGEKGVGKLSRETPPPREGEPMGASFGRMESEPMLTPREKSPLPEAQRRIEPATLHHAGQ